MNRVGKTRHLPQQVSSLQDSLWGSVCLAHDSNRECGSQHHFQSWFPIFSLQVFRKCILGNNGVDAQGSNRSCICNSQNDCSLEKMDTCTMHACMYEYLKMILSHSSNAPLIYSLHGVRLASSHSFGLIFCMKSQCLYLLLLLSLVQKQRRSE